MSEVPPPHPPILATLDSPLAESNSIACLSFRTHSLPAGHLVSPARVSSSFPLPCLAIAVRALQGAAGWTATRCILVIYRQTSVYSARHWNPAA